MKNNKILCKVLKIFNQWSQDMSLFEMEEQFQSQIVTKNIRTIISSIETSLSSNEDYTISYLSNHFFGADSQIVIKSFLSQVKQIITKKTTKISINFPPFEYRQAT